MKKKGLISSLVLALVIGLGITAYAASTPNNHEGTGIGLGRTSGYRGYDIVTKILKDKGVADSEINASLNSGKTLNSLAKEKGISDDELKKSMLSEKTKIIDDAVAKKTITKEQGDAEKARIKENVNNCTNIGQMTGRKNMEGRGNFNGLRGGNRSGCINNITK